MGNALLFRFPDETRSWLHGAAGSLDRVTFEACDGIEELDARGRAEGGAPIDAVVIGAGELEPAAIATRVRSIAPHASIAWLGRDAVRAREAGVRAIDPTAAARAIAAVIEEEAACARARREAEAKQRAPSGSLLGEIAHDVRAPLAVIAGGIAELEHPAVGSLNDDQAVIAGLVRRGVARLHALAAAIAALAQIEAGATIACAEVNVCELAKRAVDRIRDDAIARGVTVRCETPDAGATIDGDEEKLALLVATLAESAARAASREVCVRVASHDGVTRLEVVDDRPRAAAASRGLGGRVVRAIARAHGGSVRDEPARVIADFPARERSRDSVAA